MAAQPAGAKPLKISGRNFDTTNGLCGGHVEPNRWYVDDQRALRETTNAAIKLCNTPCPIKDECLDYALVNKIKFGVWGGRTSRERTGILKSDQRVLARTPEGRCSMKRLICVWFHRGVMPVIATRLTVGQFGIKHRSLGHENEGEWLPFNIYEHGAASAWPRRGVGTND